MSQKFLTNIELDAGLVDGSNSTGDAGQLLSSTISGTAWIDPTTISSGSSEKVVIYAKNTHTASIAKGTPVYITGTVGATDTVEIAPADAGNSAKMPAVGLLDETLAVNDFGYVITGGFMDNITTDPIDGATPSSNDTVYVKSGGGLTLTKPTGSQLIQNIAKVGKVSGGNSGSLIVSSILRTNDVPNLTQGKVWVGSTGNTIESAVVHLDEANSRMGIGTTAPTNLLTLEASSPIIDLKSTNSYPYSRINFLNSSGTAVSFIESASNPAISYLRLSYGLTPSISSGITLDDGFLQLDTAGSERLRITNTGNVGIGTTSPYTKLEVVGTISSGAGASAANLGMEFGGLLNPASMPSQIRGVIGALNSGTGVIAGSIGYQPRTGVSASHIFFTEQSEKVRIDSSGNVGIGTASPATILHIDDNASTGSGLKVTGGGGGSALAEFVRDVGATGTSIKMHASANFPQMTMRSTGNTYSVGVDSSGNFKISDNASIGTNDRVTISNIGSVGIGTTSPDSTTMLSIESPVRGGFGLFCKTVGVNNWSGFYHDSSSNFSMVLRNGSGTQTAKVASSGNSYFNGGNVGIGTTSPTTTLSLGAATTGISFLSTSTGFNSGKIAVIKQEEVGSGNGNLIFETYQGGSGGAERMRITNAGNVGIGATSPSYQLQLSLNSAAKPTSSLWIVVSDARVKENIRDYTSGLSKVLQIEPKLFDYNGKAGFGKTKDNIGIIAQDMKNIMPETINTYKAKLNESDEEDTELYNFDGHALTFALINSIKELHQQISELKTELENIKSKQL